MRKVVLIVVAVLHLLLVDAVTKELAVAHLKGTPGNVVVRGFFNLFYVENRGCAWGMFQNHVWPLAAFGVLALAAIVWKRRDLFSLDASGWRRKAGIWCELLLYAGIVGNLIDRIFRGCVVDFLDFHWGEAYHFPCFNVADVYICTAAGLLILSSLAAPEREGKKGASAEPAPKES